MRHSNTLKMPIAMNPDIMKLLKYATCVLAVEMKRLLVRIAEERGRYYALFVKGAESIVTVKVMEILTTNVINAKERGLETADNARVRR